MRSPVLFGCIILFLIIHGAGDHQSFIQGSQSFRPVYSHNLTGHVSVDHPLRIDIDIRDSETGFVKIYAWGENGTDWKLMGAKESAEFLAPDLLPEEYHLYPRVVTLRNLSSDYVFLDPGAYSLYFESPESEGEASVLVEYVYLDNIDTGLILKNTTSIWKIEVPEGLERIVFITESVSGTDLDLYIQKGTDLPSSLENCTYQSTSKATYQWEPGIENYIAEIMSVQNPSPGPYLMVTKASGDDDIFYSYWMGVEKNKT